MNKAEQVTQGAPRPEELISLQRLIENISLFSEISEEEIRGRVSPNMRGEEASFEYALRLGAIRGLLSEKAAVIKLLSAFNATLDCRPACYLLYDGHAIEDESIRKDLNFYLLHLKLTRFIDPPRGAERWGETPPPQGMTGRFDAEKIGALYFRRDQIRSLLEECHIKHSIGASNSSPISAEYANVVGESSNESRSTVAAESVTPERSTETVVPKFRGKVAALEKEYLEAQRRATNKYDRIEIQALLFKMALEGGTWAKLVVENNALYQISQGKKQPINLNALEQWLAKRKAKDKVT